MVIRLFRSPEMIILFSFFFFTLILRFVYNVHSVSSLQWRLALQERCGFDWERCGSGPGYWWSTFLEKGTFVRDMAASDTDDIQYGIEFLTCLRLLFWDQSVVGTVVEQWQRGISCFLLSRDESLEWFISFEHVKRQCSQWKGKQVKTCECWKTCCWTERVLWLILISMLGVNGLKVCMTEFGLWRKWKWWCDNAGARIIRVRLQVSWFRRENSPNYIRRRVIRVRHNQATIHQKERSVLSKPWEGWC